MSTLSYMQRKISLPDEITSYSAKMFIHNLHHIAGHSSSLTLDRDNITTILHKSPFFVEVASSGGCIYAMQHIITHLLAAQSDNIIGTINTSRSASAAAIISIFGMPGLRLAVEGATYMFHPIQMMISQPLPVSEISTDLTRLKTFEKNIYTQLMDHMSYLDLTDIEKGNIKELLLSTKEVNLTAADMIKLKLVDYVIKPKELYGTIETIILDIVTKRKDMIDENPSPQPKQRRKRKKPEDNAKKTDKTVRRSTGSRGSSKES